MLGCAVTSRSQFHVHSHCGSARDPAPRSLSVVQVAATTTVLNIVGCYEELKKTLEGLQLTLQYESDTSLLSTVNGQALRPWLYLILMNPGRTALPYAWKEVKQEAGRAGLK